MNYMDQILNQYYADGAKKLHAIVDKILLKFGGIYQKDYDDFYSIANEVCAEIAYYKRFDESKGDFGGYVYKAIYCAIQDEISKRNCQKRQADKDAVSIYAPIGDDDGTLMDVISSDYSIENELIESGVVKDEKVEEYLNSLSNLTRKVVEMKMNGEKVEYIKEQLNLSNKAYEKCMKEAKMNENISMFTKNVNDGNYFKTEVSDMSVDEVIMDIESADSYRMDKYTVYSLLDAIKEGEINKKYILQRKQFQWTAKQVNKFLSRILNNQPIPEIVICEQRIKDLLIKWLIDGLQRLGYLEAFKENRLVIGKAGAEYTSIKYREYLKDEDGNRIIDEDGVPKYEVKVFDIVGKKYSDLPDFLKKRFNNFNINVTTFFNCTPEQIAYHIRNYNNHVAMSKTQYGVTNLDEDVARNIKSISDKHSFFKNCGNFTDANISKGVIDRVVVESVMAIHYIDHWKKSADEAFEYVNENAMDEDFEIIKGYLDELEDVIEKDKKSVFNATNTFIWLAAYDKLVKQNITSEQFGQFVKVFENGLSEKEINGTSYATLNKKRNTKDKSLIVEKINKIVELMLDYLHINKEETIEEYEVKDDRIAKFISDFVKSKYAKAFKLTYKDCKRIALTYLANIDILEEASDDVSIINAINEKGKNLSDDVIEDTLLALDVLCDLSDEVDCKSNVFAIENIPVLLTAVDAIIKDELDDIATEWFIRFVKEFKADAFGKSYKEKCFEILYNLNQFCELSKKESA